MCQVRLPHHPVKLLKTIATIRANPHPFRPILSTTTWKLWRRVAFRTRHIAPIRLPVTSAATPSVTQRAATRRKTTSTRTWRFSPSLLHRGFNRFFNVAIRKTARPAVRTITLTRMCASNVVVRETSWPQEVLTWVDIWPEATPKREIIRMRTCTFRRTSETSRNRHSKRYTYLEWRLERDPSTSKSVEKWIITRARLSWAPEVASRKMRQLV